MMKKLMIAATVLTISPLLQAASVSTSCSEQQFSVNYALKDNETCTAEVLLTVNGNATTKPLELMPSSGSHQEPLAIGDEAAIEVTLQCSSDGVSLTSRASASTDTGCAELPVNAPVGTVPGVIDDGGSVNIPDLPEMPGVPEMPMPPSTPSAPGNSDGSDTPSAPGNSDGSDTPEVPTTPINTGDDPSVTTPTTPTVPTTPATPTDKPFDSNALRASVVNNILDSIENQLTNSVENLRSSGIDRQSTLNLRLQILEKVIGARLGSLQKYLEAWSSEDMEGMDELEARVDGIRQALNDAITDLKPTSTEEE